jgi:hypothetical protein
MSPTACFKIKIHIFATRHSIKRADLGHWSIRISWFDRVSNPSAVMR